jgi:hypothetical protein
MFSVAYYNHARGCDTVGQQRKEFSQKLSDWRTMAIAARAVAPARLP